MQDVSHRVGALKSLPVPRDWLDLGVTLLVLTPMLLAIGIGGGLMTWAPRFDEAMARLALVALLAPALGEEVLFRAALIPTRRTAPTFPWKAALVSTVLFVAWHPIQVFVFGPDWGETVLDPWFLLAVALLGLGCARLYWKSGSIWTAVALHWIVVVAWKALLSGPSPW